MRFYIRISNVNITKNNEIKNYLFALCKLNWILPILDSVVKASDLPDIVSIKKAYK